jgi:benzoate membrane transport protein
MSIARYFSLSAVVAGFVTVLVGFTSSAVIVFQAANAVGAGPAEIASWMWALGLGMGLTSIALSLRYRMPVSIASGMLAGVLLRFGLEVFVVMKTQFPMAFSMFAVYLVTRRLVPRYAVICAFALGIVIAAAQGTLHMEAVRLELAKPVWVMPSLSVSALIGVALPLFVVTMASQNVPGVAVIRASGYPIPISPVIGWTGVANLIFAPFGAFAINLAAITAAICMGREAHEDTRRRYVASVSAGFFYILIGLFGATVGALFAAFPRELVVSIAGLALIGTIGNGLAAALSNARDREPALVTFLVSASGVTLLGIGSAFWGLIAGSLTLLVLRAGLGARH